MLLNEINRRLENVNSQIASVDAEMQNLVAKRNQINAALENLAAKANQFLGQRDLLQSLLTTELSEPESESEPEEIPPEE